MWSLVCLLAANGDQFLAMILALNVRSTYCRFIHSMIIPVFYLFIGNYYGYSQTGNQEDLLYSSIHSGDIETVRYLLDTSNINMVFKKDSLTPLVSALKATQPKIVKYLLDNKADPNIRCKGRSPIMYACQENSKMQIHLLLAKGANVNEVDSDGNTALMIAAASQPHGIARLLLHYRASLNARNHEGLTARDIANFANNKSMLNYLRTMFEGHLPNYFDGPYALYRGKNNVEVSYFKHDSLRKRTDKYTRVYNLNQTKGLIRGFAGDTLTNVLKTKFEPESSVVSGVDKICVIGDIHGQCDTLKKFLINNHITDQRLKWNFGSGHLVFLGDIFDRGEQVTDVLWLIYRLENEAALFGGKVHLLLGNHEIMIFSDDTRYLSDKYYYLFENLHIDYHKYYGNKTVMGRWLRSKNTMLKINDILFVHGGIHPDLLKYNVSIDSINMVLNKYLNSKNKYNNFLLDFLFSDKGPFWYRGMIPSDNRQDCLSEKDINHIINYFNINKVMVGHTNQPHITSYYSGKVYGLDVPFYYFHGSPMEAMYIDLSGYYRVFTNGEKEKIRQE